ncbi:hypothetical protein FOA43_002891 [Brettanomyces nanus]|uniref:Protein transport protein SEC31 n=1 Tax=Eeniella nana TaxID=13502 RepID=A0A875S2G6_EENNA|nr:uncharacterized protein FOA43_002891 [Brettanomyces nanus]QPG75536.1 hypothetical protein FOA43_002891 [Brettanomyces nanus]
MVKLCEINETVAFAWSLDALPVIATGTLSGVMDDTFSSDSFLQIYNPFETNVSKRLLFKAASDAKYNSLSWSNSTSSYSRGLLAGGLEDNTIQLYNPDHLLKSSPSKLSILSTYSKHTSPVLQVKFNPIQHHILGSSGSKGEIFVWDTNKGTCFTPGRAMSPVGKVSCLDWNNTVSHIFASAGDTGYASIWDLKAKREVLQLSYSGVNLSVVAWHPSQSTKLVTASGSDLDPVILTWDLRNSSTPEKVLKGHRKAILSLDWCRQDAKLLLSSGKDDTTMLWNPIEGKKLAEYPSLPNWIHQTNFAPRLPDVFASASLDKKMVIQTLQDTSPPVSTKVGGANEDEFWNKISSTDTQQPIFQEKQAPAWLSRPISANFGFGGRIAIARKDTKSGNSIVKIVPVTGVEVVDESASTLVQAIKKHDYEAVCDSRLKIEKAFASGKDWVLLKKLLEKGQKELLGEILDTEKQLDIESSSSEDEKVGKTSPSSSDDDFFRQLGSAKKAEAVAQYSPKGKFTLSNDSSDDYTKKLTSKILEAKFEDALDLCVAENHILEALVLALNGTEEMKTKAKSAYFTKYASQSSLARLLYSASSKDISDVVNNANIGSWKQIARSIVAFGELDNSGSGPSIDANITKLGDRLMDSKETDARDNAITCYIAGNSLDKIAHIWLSELDDIEKFYLEQSNESDKKKLSESDIRFRALGEVIEKVFVYQSTASVGSDGASSDLEELGDAFKEYAEYLTNAGQFELAFETLSMVSENIPGIKLEKRRLEKVMGRSAHSNTTVQPAAKYSKPTAKYQNYAPVAAGGYPTTPLPMAPAVNHTSGLRNPYATMASSARAGSMSNGPRNMYGPQGPAGGVPPGSSLPPPPKVESRVSYSSRTPSANRDAGGWNDLPESMNIEPPKRDSVSNTAAASPYQLQAHQGPYNGPSAIPAQRSPSIPPPPKAGAGATAAVNGNEPLPSSVPSRSRIPSLNPYAPTQPAVYPGIPAPTGANFQASAAPIGGMNSPQALPMSPRAAPRNPYAPAPAQSPRGSFASPLARPGFSPQPNFAQPTFAAPPPRGGAGVVGNGFVDGPSVPPPPPLKKKAAEPPISGTAPPVQTVPALQQPLPQSPLPPNSISGTATSSAVPPESPEEPIPANAQPIYTLLTAEMEKVKPKIPAKFSKQLTDAEKRLNILFDHLSSGDLLSEETVESMVQLSEALSKGDFGTASSLQAQISTNHADECGVWMVGVKRLIGMDKATSSSPAELQQ